MAQPRPYERDYDFTSFQVRHATTPPPGNKLDDEFDQIAATIDEVLSRIAILQRDDLQLANSLVGYDQLKPELRNGFTTPTAWATATRYAIGTSVYVGAKVYATLVAHTSGVFATDLTAGRWHLLADFTVIAGVGQSSVDAAVAAAKSAQEAAESAFTASTAAMNAQALLDTIDVNDVTTLAAISADITAAVANAADISTVAGVVSDIPAVAGIAAEVATVAGIAPDVTAAAVNMAAINAAPGAAAAAEAARDEALAAAATVVAKDFASRAGAVAVSISSGVSHIRTAGYSVVGDGGAALYKRVGTEPSHAGKFQSADGAWWELVETEPTDLMFGAKADGVTDDAPALQALLDYAAGGTAYVPSRGAARVLKAPLQIPTKTTLLLDRTAVILRGANIDNMIRNKSDGTIGGYDAGKDIHIDGGVWDGNSANFPIDATLIAFGHCTGVSVRRAKILNVPGRYHAIEFNATQYGVVADCYFKGGGNNNSAGECIQLDTAATGGPFPWFGPYDNTNCAFIDINNNQIDNWAVGVGGHTPARHINILIADNQIRASVYGIHPMGWSGVRITGNRIEGINDPAVTNVGIFVDHMTGGNRDFVISSNDIYNFTGSNLSRGIYFNCLVADKGMLSHITIANNNIDLIGRHGVGFDHCSDISVSGNVIRRCGNVGLWSFGADRVSITGNTVTGNNTSNTAQSDINLGGASVNTAQNAVTGNVAGSATVANNVVWSVVRGNVFTSISNSAPASSSVGHNNVSGTTVA